MKCAGYIGALAALFLAACGEAAKPQVVSPTGEMSPEAADMTPAADASWSWDLACDHPVRVGQTSAELHRAFGNDARDEILGGPEGTEIPGLALWPDDAERRLEVIFDEEDGKAFVLRPGPDSLWRVAGLGLGSTLAEVRRANGRPFELWGFSWDYGGYVSDLEGGALAELPGGCMATFRFEPDEQADLPDRTMGDVTLSSDDPAISNADIRLTELGLSFPRGGGE